MVFWNRLLDFRRTLVIGYLRTTLRIDGYQFPFLETVQHSYPCSSEVVEDIKSAILYIKATAVMSVCVGSDWKILSVTAHSL
jgi:hypothetical protein